MVNINARVRKRWISLVFLGCSVILCLLPGEGVFSAPYHSYRVVGYYTSWSIYTAQYFVTDIPAEQLTHINYAFLNLSDQGGCTLGDELADIYYLYPNDSETDVLRGNFKQLQQLKQRYPDLKTLMSVGGWTWSDRFSDAALTPESRAVFIQSCINFMKTYGFDGIDIDWEFPVSGGLVKHSGRPEDKENFTRLLAELRAQLDIQGEIARTHYLLTIAAPQTPQFYAYFEMDKIHPYLDWINLMSYTFHGGWSPITNLHAPLYASSSDPSEDEVTRLKFNVDAAVQAYLEAGVPADKIVVGAPFYGHGWSGVANVNHGLYQSFTGLPDATWGDGVYDYRDLEANYLDSYQRFWHEEAQVPWLYDPGTQIMISYEDPESLSAKADYVQQQGLGGMMIWELSYDSDDHTLLNEIYTDLNSSIE
ncbi:MAG: glycoside hydrolase family 18 protein [Chloroflexi bacterium]|nr:glycoside hydrolase family 18 protein [Chloroflexota bacterium]